MSEASEKIELRDISLDDLILDPGNPRNQTDTGKSRLERSLEHYGFVSPVIAYRLRAEDAAEAARTALNAPAGTLLVVVGHQRLAAARVKGFNKSPVIIYPFRSLREARAYNIADNKLGEMGIWDFPKLKDRFEDLDDGAFDMDLTGFLEVDRKALLTFAGGGAQEGGENSKTIKCPECGYEWTLKSLK